MYQSKTERINKAIWRIIDSIKQAEDKRANFESLAAQIAVNVGVKIKEVKEQLETFEKAGLIEIKDGEIFM